MEPVRAHVDRNLFKYVQVTSTTETCIQFLLQRIFGALRLLSCLIRPILHGQACLDFMTTRKMEKLRFTRTLFGLFASPFLYKRRY